MQNVRSSPICRTTGVSVGKLNIDSASNQSWKARDGAVWHTRCRKTFN